MRYNFRAIGKRPAGVHPSERIAENEDFDTLDEAQVFQGILSKMWGMTVIFDECEY